MNRRLFYQYGLLLPVAPHGFVNQGLGKRVSAGATGLIAPTRIVEDDIENGLLVVTRAVQNLKHLAHRCFALQSRIK